MQIEPQHISVSHAGEVSLARGAAREMALKIGFAEKESDEIALAVSELASNLVKHAGGGTIIISPESTGIMVESHDRGPGIKDAGLAMTDGFSTAGSLGFGLGAISRLMDSLEICTHPGKGTHMVCRRSVRDEAAVPLPGPMEFGAATRSHPRMSVNGDAFVIKQWGKALS